MTARTRVLIVNHTSSVSGGELSLLDLMRALPDWVDAHLACPEGELARLARSQGATVFVIPATDVSFRWHPVRTPSGLLKASRAVAAVRRLTVRGKPHLVHANSVRAGLICAAATAGGSIPLMVHVRDLLPENRGGQLVRRIVSRAAVLVVGNSEFVARKFAVPRSRARLRWVHSPVDLARFNPGFVDRASARRALGLPATAPILGVVGQLTPWKAQDDAIRVTAALRHEFPKIQLAIVGEARFVGAATSHDNRSFVENLLTMADAPDAEGSVRFTGQRSDIPIVMRALDVLLAPSWAEPFGRSIVEAMAMGTAVVASSVGGPAEIITDGIDGFLRPPRRPTLWTEPVTRLLNQPALRAHIGAAARTRAASFRLEHHALAIAELYKEALGTVATGAGAALRPFAGS
jgi:L-malate glycosyltransferase